MVNRLDIEHSEHNIQNYTVSCNIIIEYKFIGEEKDYRKILLNFVVRNDKMDLKEYSQNN